MWIPVMSDAFGLSASYCRVECVGTSADVKSRPVLKTPKTKKLLDFDNVRTDSPVSELAKDLGELSTSV